MNKKVWSSLVSAGLLLTLTACGLKIDNKTLSEQGGVWSMNTDEGEYIFKFSEDGKVKLVRTDDVLYSQEETYKIEKKDGNIDLEMGKMTLVFPKKEQDKPEESLRGTWNGENIHLERKNSSYLDHLQQEAKDAKAAQEEAKRKEKEAQEKEKKEIEQNRKTVFSKIIKEMKPMGENGKGKIDTSDFDIAAFNKDDLNLDIQNEYAIDYQIENNGHLKNGKKVKVTVTEGAAPIYEEKITIKGLDVYAKKASDLKNMSEVQQELTNHVEKENEGDTLVKKAFYYLPHQGKVVMLCEIKEAEDIIGNIRYHIEVEETKPLAIDKEGKTKLPLNEDEITRNDQSSSTYYEDEVQSDWNDQVQRLTKSGAEKC